MARTLLPWVSTVAILMLAWVASMVCTPVRPAYAHDRGDFLAYLPSTAIRKIEERGFGLYRLDARANAFANFRPTLGQMYGAECAQPVVCWYEQTDPFGDYDLLWVMPDDWTYGPGVAGVAWYTLSPARIDLNWRLPYSSWLTTAVHESGHIEGQEDLYIHPLTCDPARKWTRMSCGTGVGRLTDYDRDIVYNVFVPDLPSQVGMFCDSTWCWMQYNSIRASAVSVPYALASWFAANQTEQDNFGGHYSKYLDNVTRVSIWLRRSAADEWFWSGFYGPPAPLNGFEERGFLRADWCNQDWEFGVHPENAMPITWPIQAGGVGFLSGEIRSVGSC